MSQHDEDVIAASFAFQLMRHRPRPWWLRLLRWIKRLWARAANEAKERESNG